MGVRVGVGAVTFRGGRGLNRWRNVAGHIALGRTLWGAWVET